MGGLKRLERAGKLWVRGGLRVLWGRCPPPPRPLSVQGVSRIAVIRGDNRLGNLLLLTPLLEALRSTFTAARIDVLVSADAYPDVYRGHRAIDDVVAVPKKGMARNPLRSFSFARDLKRRRYDLVFDASHMHEFSLTSAWAARLTRAAFRVGYDRGDADLFLNVRVAPPPPGTHEAEIHVRLLREALPDASLPAPDALCPHVETTLEERARASAWWNQAGLPDTAVGFFVGARGNKQWDMAKFLELSDRVLAAGRACVLFGGPPESEALAAIPATEGRVVAPVLPVREFAALLERCQVVVSADTGPMHLAVALGRPTLEIFLASDPARYGYAHLPGHRVLGGVDAAVSVDEAWAGLRELMEAAPAPVAVGKA